MDLSTYEVGYFIEQVALSAASFGVAQSDLMVVGTALNSLFGYRCAPATTVIPAQGAQLQSICTDNTCPVAVNSTCSGVQNVTKPAIANSSLVGNATATAGSSGPAQVTTNAAATAGLSAAAVLGAAAMLLL
jgi:hypothetical protein